MLKKLQESHLIDVQNTLQKIPSVLDVDISTAELKPYKQSLYLKNKLILRIGLARDWTRDGTFSPRNYIQINSLIGI